jgi:hypothetical protein
MTRWTTRDDAAVWIADRYDLTPWRLTPGREAELKQELVAVAWGHREGTEAQLSAAVDDWVARADFR